MNEPNVEPSIWRVLDSNLNRATEAIRVVEDCIRFSLNDSRLCEIAKNTRHELVQIVKKVSSSQPEFRHHLMAMRDSVGDVGRTISNDSEQSRDGILDILCANLKRFQQAARCLEEAGKVVDQPFAKSMEQIRYDAYSIERQIFSTLHNQERLQRDWLCVLVDAEQSDSQFAKRIRELVESDIPMLQLRHKQLDSQISDEELLQRARILNEITRESTTRWIFNDRADLAFAGDADGVHLGQDDLSVAAARRILGPNKLIGVSTHSIDQVDQAIQEGADYLGFGPVFPSNTKSFEQFVGLEMLAKVANYSSLPTFAIGGISLNNVDDVFRSGIQRIAVTGMFGKNVNIAEAMTELKRIREGTTA